MLTYIEVQNMYNSIRLSVLRSFFSDFNDSMVIGLYAQAYNSVLLERTLLTIQWYVYSNLEQSSKATKDERKIIVKVN